MEDARRALLLTLGDGGTMEMVDRLMAANATCQGVQPSDLVGLAEIAARLNVTKQRLWNWKDDPRRHFPRPVVTLKCGSVFSWEQVHCWVVGNSPLPTEADNGRS